MTCCEEPKNHKYKCPFCIAESNNAKQLVKHQKLNHPNKIHSIIHKCFTLTQESQS